MSAAMIVLSFVCAFLIVASALAKRVRTSIPHLAITLWLGTFNLIRAINAVLWLNNINIHIPVWCDIVTKLMLGTSIALPGALLCMAMELRLLSSEQKLPTNPIILRNRNILELVICYFIPVIYMTFHILVQDRRFDIVRDLGCSAATHPSNFGFLLVWIPPLSVSAFVIIFSGISLHNSQKPLSTPFSDHIKSRSSMTSSLFFRRLATVSIMVVALCLRDCSDLFTIPNYESWTSVAAVHKFLNVIRIVQPEVDSDPYNPHEDLQNIQTAWWGMLVISILYVVLSLMIGEESRDAYRWIAKQFKKIQKKKFKISRDLLPVYKINLKIPASTPSTSELVPQSPASIKSNPLPLTLELKSGWDDTLNEKTPRRLELLRNPRSHSPQTPTTPTRGRSLTTSPSSLRSIKSKQSIDEDKAFIESTITYLGSPTAKSLGLQYPPPVLSPPARLAYDAPFCDGPSAPSTPTRPPRSAPRAAPKFVPEDVEPVFGSVLNEPWPVPPASPAPSMSSPSRYSTRPHSLRSQSSHSPASSAEEIIASAVPTGYTSTAGLRGYAAPCAAAETRPFDASSVSSFVIEDDAPPGRQPAAGKVPIISSGLRTLGRQWSRDRLRQGARSPRPMEGIKMTVVQETA